MAALVAGALVSAGATAQAKTLQFEFKKQSDVKNWRAFGAQWTITNRGYGPKKATKPGYSWTAILNMTSKMTDTDITYTATPQAKGAGFTSAVWLRAGFKETKGVYVLKGYYVYAFLDQPNKTISAAISVSKRFPQTVNPDTYNVRLCSKDIKGVNIDTHQIRVQAIGSKIKVFYKDEVLCAVTDNTYKAGYVGFSISNMNELKYITSITNGKVDYSAK
jgi:hypothetical protein